jgi:hypothetical protein
VSRNQVLPQGQVTALTTQVQSRGGVAGAVMTYPNNGSAILNTLDQAFYCDYVPDQSAFYLLFFSPNGSMELYAPPPDPNNDPSPVLFNTGTYTHVGDSLRLSFSGAQAENSTSIEFEYDKLVSFRSSSFNLCHAATAGVGTGLPSTKIFQCPSINVVSGQGYNTSKFWLHTDGEAEWLSTQVITSGGGNEINKVRYGFYVQDGDRLHLGFGNSDGIRFLSGVLNAGGDEFLIDELEPETGPCTLTGS